MKTFHTTFHISGLHCESCKKITEKRIKKISGVDEANTDLVTGTLEIHSTREISKAEVVQALANTEYTIS